MSVNLVQPINWLDPLNRGLKVKLMCLPGLQGGRRWIDLVNPGPGGKHGVLTGLDPQSDWQGPRGRPGGFGSLDNAGGYVDLGSSIILESPAELTTWAWVRPVAYGSYPGVNNFNFGGGGVTNGIVFDVDGGGRWTLLKNNLAAGSTTIRPPLNEWSLLMATWTSGPSVALYLNGINVGNNPGQGGYGMTGNSIGIGYSAEKLNALVDDTGLCNRAFSAKEAGRYFEESRSYYPMTLNHSSKRYFLLGTGAAGPETYTAVASLTVPRATLAGVAEHDAPVFTASADLTAPRATLAGTVTFAVSTFTASSSLTAPRATLSGTATFASGTFIATAGLTAPRTTLSSIAEFDVPVFTASSSLTAPRATLSGVADHDVPVYSGTVVLTTPRAVLAGVAAFNEGVFIALAGLTAPRATLAGSSLFDSPVFEAACSLTTGPAVMNASAVTSIRMSWWAWGMFTHPLTHRMEL